MEPGSFQWLDKMQWAQTETQVVPPERQETLRYCEGDCAQAQMAQRGCEGYSTEGNISHLSTKAIPSIITTALQQAL